MDNKVLQLVRDERVTLLDSLHVVTFMHTVDDTLTAYWRSHAFETEIVDLFIGVSLARFPLYSVG